MSLKPMNSTRNTTNGELRAMIHEFIESGDGARIQRDYCLMDNQELTEAEIDERRWEIFEKYLELNRQKITEPQERLKRGMAEQV
jgi:hypothetical protein